MYKLYPLNPITGEQPKTVIRLFDLMHIPFAPDNTDYQNFKKQINADEAQLETADGNLMSPEVAKAYVATLP